MRRCKNCRHFNWNLYHVAPVDLPDICGHPDHSGEIRQTLDTCADHDYIPGTEPGRCVCDPLEEAFKRIPSHFRTGEEL